MWHPGAVGNCAGQDAVLGRRPCVAHWRRDRGAVHPDRGRALVFYSTHLGRLRPQARRPRWSATEARLRPGEELVGDRAARGRGRDEPLSHLSCPRAAGWPGRTPPSTAPNSRRSLRPCQSRLGQSWLMSTARSPGDRCRASRCSPWSRTRGTYTTNAPTSPDHRRHGDIAVIDTGSGASYRPSDGAPWG